MGAVAPWHLGQVGARFGDAMTRIGHSYSKYYMQNPPMQNILRAGSGRVGSARADDSKSPQELHRSLDGKLDTVNGVDFGFR